MMGAGVGMTAGVGLGVALGVSEGGVVLLSGRLGCRSGQCCSCRLVVATI